MLTVADALKLIQAVDPQVVAGHAGLNTPVTWVHVVGVPDAARWVNGGELVLTTIINMPPTEAEQCHYLHALIDKGVAALALTVGNIIAHAPDHLCRIADERGFPLIEVPFEARFVDMARTINEHISQANMALVTRALTINRELTQLVLEGGGLKELAATLADLIGQSVSIETERFEALASANIAAFDEARRYTLREGRTDPRLVQALETRGVLAEIRETLRPVSIPQMADVGLEMERILAPIVVHGDIYGYMWIIAADRPLNDLDRLAIESGATIAALMLLYQEALQSAEASLKGGLLAQLIEGAGGRAAVLTDQALRFGFDLTAPFALLVLDPDDRTSKKLVQLYRRVTRLAGAVDGALVAGQFAGAVVVLAAADGLPRLLTRIQEGAGGLRIGVSAPARGAESVAVAYQQAAVTLHIARRLGMAARVVHIDDLGYLHTLYQAGPGALSQNPAVAGLRRLLDEQGADFFRTLEAYLDAGGNGVQTAELLHIHRSTLNYRLQRIAEICAADLSDPAARINLQVALKLLRLFEID